MIRLSARLKRRNWIQWRPGPAGHRDRRGRKQELPAMTLTGRFGEGLEIAVVKYWYAQGD